MTTIPPSGSVRLEKNDCAARRTPCIETRHRSWRCPPVRRRSCFDLGVSESWPSDTDPARGDAPIPSRFESLASPDGRADGIWLAPFYARVRILHLGNRQVVPALRALGHDVRSANEL